MEHIEHDIWMIMRVYFWAAVFIYSLIAAVLCFCYIAEQITTKKCLNPFRTED